MSNEKKKMFATEKMSKRSSEKMFMLMTVLFLGNISSSPSLIVCFFCFFFFFSLSIPKRVAFFQC